MATSSKAVRRANDTVRSIEDCLKDVALHPDDVDLIAFTAGLAARLEMHDIAAGLWRRVLERDATRLDAIDGCAKALRDQHQYADAVEFLRPAIVRAPGEARLWNTLGTVVNQGGDSASALIFFTEAARLDSRLAAAVYNRGGVHFDRGDLAACAKDFARARALARQPSERAMITFASATLALCQGRLGDG